MAVEERIVKINDDEVSVTISIGICHIAEANGSLDILLSQADQAMYWAKASGRNRVAVWNTEISQSTALDLLQRGIKIKPSHKKNGGRNEQLSKIYEETIEGWSKAIEMRDKEMEGHSQRVVDLTLELARKCGVDENDMIDIRRGAMLHDIGKIAIPDPILFKPGKLSEEEWLVMRKHPVYAKEFLSPITFLKKSIDIPFCHHEHWDGSGYPRGLKGNEIPLAARIFTIIDVWDALCSDRCYRPAWSQTDAKDYIITQSGKMFDPNIVEQFIFMLEEKFGQQGPSKKDLKTVLKITKKQKIDRDKKNGSSLGCHFSQIMGNTDQTPLSIHFFCTSEHESSEPHIVFYVAEDSFHLSRTF
jgi:HD-GYP domain-containing protein (c-di-GMP phosphodiesterase class II)